MGHTERNGVENPENLVIGCKEVKTKKVNITTKILLCAPNVRWYNLLKWGMWGGPAAWWMVGEGGSILYTASLRYLGATQRELSSRTLGERLVPQTQI